MTRLTSQHDLPIYPEVLSSPFDLAAAANSGATVLRRAVRLGRTPDRVTCLEGLLELGEEHFAALARAGLPVVDHTWGLAPVEAVPPHRQHEFVDYAGRCLPPDYFLAAEAVILYPHPLPTDRSQQLLPVSAINQYRHGEVVSYSGVSLREMNYSYGVPVTEDLEEPCQSPGFWMNTITLDFREV